MDLPFILRIYTVSRYKHKTASAKEKFNYIVRLGRHQNNPSEVSWLCVGNMPGWVSATDTREFWKAVDKYERKNGVLCQQIMFVLPIVLSKDQKVALTEKFVEAVIDNRVLPYTYAIHEIHGRNPHCHLMFSERMNDGLDRTPKTWFKKARLQPEDRLVVRPLKSPDEKSGTRKANIYHNSGGAKRYYLKTRKLWETHANKALEEAGRPERIDCRSFKKRNINRIPKIRSDSVIKELEKRGVTTANEMLSKRLERANNRIIFIENQEERSNLKHEMDMFELGETKTRFEKNFENLSAEAMQEIAKNFIRKIEERAETDVIYIDYQIDWIKRFKEIIRQRHCNENHKYKNDFEKKVFNIVKRKITQTEGIINNLENNMRKFYLKQEKQIVYFLMELSDYLPKPYIEKKLKYYSSKLYIKDDKHNKIIKLTKEIPAEQYPERTAIAKRHGQLNQAEAKNLPVEGKQTDTAKKTGQEKVQDNAEQNQAMADKDAQFTKNQKESQAIVENHPVDEAAIVKEAENGGKEDKETSEELKKEKRLENMSIGEYIEEMREKYNFKDEKPKTKQSKIEQPEQDKAKQPKIKQTKGLEDEQEKAKRKKTRKKAGKTEDKELDKESDTEQVVYGDQEIKKAVVPPPPKLTKQPEPVKGIDNLKLVRGSDDPNVKKAINEFLDNKTPLLVEYKDKNGEKILKGYGVKADGFEYDKDGNVVSKSSGIKIEYEKIELYKPSTQGIDSIDSKGDDGQATDKDSDIPQTAPGVDQPKPPKFNLDDLIVIDTTKDDKKGDEYVLTEAAESESKEFKEPTLWIIKDLNGKLVLGGTGGVNPDDFKIERDHTIKTVDEDIVIQQPAPSVEEPGTADVASIDALGLTDDQKEKALESRIKPKKLWGNSSTLETQKEELNKLDISWVVLRSFNDKTVIDSNNVSEEVIRKINDKGKGKDGMEL